MLQLWMGVMHVNVGNMLGEALIIIASRLVEDEKQQVETREKGGWEIDVFNGGDAWVIAAVKRVRSSEDGGTSIKRRGDTGLGDGDSLLLHDFVNGSPVGLLHLIELVNAADSIVGKHECAALWWRPEIS
jgi:hypothetical protein